MILVGQRRRQRAPDSRVELIGAPIGGWNTKDPLATMGPQFASVLDNWYPQPAELELRGGYTDHATGFANPPRTLALYTPPSGLNKMFAGTSNGIFDVSSAGAIGAAVTTSTNGDFQWTQMGVAAGHYLMMFNGVDKPRYWDGTTWTLVDGVSTPAITGVTTTGLFSAYVFKQRLFFLEINKLSFWYLTTVSVVGGAASEFRLGNVCQRGGTVVAMGSWTVDAGSGPDDFAVFVTSEGEVAVFQGTDPGISTAWAHVGTYSIPKPIGRRCLITYGASLLVLTERGVWRLPQDLQSSDIATRTQLSDKVEPSFTTVARGTSALFGWQPIVFPARGALLVNVPISASVSHQYVMNLTTKAWCRFTGWNALTFIVFNKDLYASLSNKVIKVWTGAVDGVDAVLGLANQGSVYLPPAGLVKQVVMARPILRSTGGVTIRLGMIVDFKETVDLSTLLFTSSGGSLWDSGLWDSAIWGGGLEPQSPWLTPPARIGNAFATVFQAQTNSAEVFWTSNAMMYKRGGLLP